MSEISSARGLGDDDEKEEEEEEDDDEGWDSIPRAAPRRMAGPDSCNHNASERRFFSSRLKPRMTYRSRIQTKPTTASCGRGNIIARAEEG